MITVSSIYELRKELGWTQEELAQVIDMDQSTISCYENGASIPFWTLKKLKKVAIHHKISLDIDD
jgi:DNA-binding XRE family transcriptional regulator